LSAKDDNFPYGNTYIVKNDTLYEKMWDVGPAPNDDFHYQKRRRLNE
jgi:hypothetical protein